MVDPQLIRHIESDLHIAAAFVLYIYLTCYLIAEDDGGAMIWP